MATVDRGSTVLIEVEFKRRAPFVETPVLFDPTTPKITITDPLGVAKVTDAALTKYATGQYYYICQTLTNWEPGGYTTTASGIDGSYSDVDIRAGVFALK